MAENKKALVLITTKRPPSEPPPSSETRTPHIEEDQWVDDVITTAADSLSIQDAHHATNLSTCAYTPRINKLSSDKTINKHLLSNQRHRNNTRCDNVPLRCTLQPHFVYQLHIPTPKGGHHIPQVHTMNNAIHNTTWKNEPSQHWTPNRDGTWSPPPNPEPPDNRLTAAVPTHTTAIPYNTLLQSIRVANKSSGTNN